MNITLRIALPLASNRRGAGSQPNLLGRLVDEYRKPKFYIVYPEGTSLEEAREAKAAKPIIVSMLNARDVLGIPRRQYLGVPFRAAIVHFKRGALPHGWSPSRPFPDEAKPSGYSMRTTYLSNWLRVYSIDNLYLGRSFLTAEDGHDVAVHYDHQMNRLGKSVRVTADEPAVYRNTPEPDRELLAPFLTALPFVHDTPPVEV